MKLFLACAVLLLTSFAGFAQKADTRYFELRVYYAAAGKLDILNQRFRGTTTRVFEKVGMDNIGYWVPVKNDFNAMAYILAYPSKEARKASWDKFLADPEWKEALKKSEETGKVLDSIRATNMNISADIMPMLNIANGSAERIFELRTYTCYPDKLPNLIARFRDHTVKLFEKHGMTNVAYFISEEPGGKQSKLVYVLAHKSVDAATASWAAFRADPAWITAKENSEKEGKIVVKAESIYLKPLDFSKLK